MHIQFNGGEFSQNPASVSPRLRQAAEEFEAQMMKELLQPLSHAEGAENGEEQGGFEEALGSYSLDALGTAISKSGGLGIAKEILAHFSRNGKVS